MICQRKPHRLQTAEAPGFPCSCHTTGDRAVLQTPRSPAGWPGLAQGGESRKGKESRPGTGERQSERGTWVGGSRGEGRASAARLPGKTDRRDVSVCTIKEKGKEKKQKTKKTWLRAKRLLIYTRTPELLGRPSSSARRNKRQPSEQGAGPPKLGGPLRSRARAAPAAPTARPPPPRPSRPPIPASPPDRPWRRPRASPPPPPAALGAATAASSPPRVSAETPPP